MQDQILETILGSFNSLLNLKPLTFEEKVSGILPLLPECVNKAQEVKTQLNVTQKLIDAGSHPDLAKNISFIQNEWASISFPTLRESDLQSKMGDKIEAVERDLKSIEILLEMASEVFNKSPESDSLPSLQVLSNRFDIVIQFFVVRKLIDEMLSTSSNEDNDRKLLEKLNETNGFYGLWQAKFIQIVDTQYDVVLLENIQQLSSFAEEMRNTSQEAPKEPSRIIPPDEIEQIKNQLEIKKSVDAAGQLIRDNSPYLKEVNSSIKSLSSYLPQKSKQEIQEIWSGVKQSLTDLSQSQKSKNITQIKANTEKLTAKITELKKYIEPYKTPLQDLQQAEADIATGNKRLAGSLVGGGTVGFGFFIAASVLAFSGPVGWGLLGVGLAVIGVSVLFGAKSLWDKSNAEDQLQASKNSIVTLSTENVAFPPVPTPQAHTSSPAQELEQQPQKTPSDSSPQVSGSNHYTPKGLK